MSCRSWSCGICETASTCIEGLELQPGASTSSSFCSTTTTALVTRRHAVPTPLVPHESAK